MDNNHKSKLNGGHLNLRQLLLLLCLAGLHPVLSSDQTNPEPDDDDNEGIEVVISGPDYVTVGVPSSAECVSSCSACTYSMSMGGQAAQGQGNVLAFTLNIWVETLTVMCTVTNDATGVNATTVKKMQVLIGPVNVSITGSKLINPSVSHTFSCHAYCRPSCSYAWKIDKGPWVSGQGNVISITPKEMDVSKMLICKATNTVSGLFVAATHNIVMISGPSDIQIKGPNVVEVGERTKYVCTAECQPSCRYVSSVDSQSMRGNTVEVTIEDPSEVYTIKCEAQNTASRKTVTASKTIQIKGSNRNLSARPEEAKALLFLAFIIAMQVN